MVITFHSGVNMIEYVVAGSKLTIGEIIDLIVEHPRFYNKVEEPVLMLIAGTAPWTLQHMARPSNAVLETAISANPKNIQYINKPPRDIQLMAVSMDPDTFRLINNPAPEVYSLWKLMK